VEKVPLLIFDIPNDDGTNVAARANDAKNPKERLHIAIANCKVEENDLADVGRDEQSKCGIIFGIILFVIKVLVSGCQ